MENEVLLDAIRQIVRQEVGVVAQEVSVVRQEVVESELRLTRYIDSVKATLTQHINTVEVNIGKRIGIVEQAVLDTAQNVKDIQGKLDNLAVVVKLLTKTAVKQP